MVRRFGAGLAALLMTASVAQASGPGTLEPWYVDAFGGGKADLAKLYDGRLGVVMATTPKPQLYIAWRLLHGQKVGAKAGEALSIPCCDPTWRYDYALREGKGPEGWLAARGKIPGVTAINYIDTERSGPEYTSIPTCFDEAFDTATATLGDRAARYGAGSAAVKAWTAAQDAVFSACSGPVEGLPAEPADAPGWLKQDRAYQSAALALYNQDYEAAAAGFAAIARDKASPWRASAPYLRTRSLVRAAMVRKTPQDFAAARKALKELAAMPAGTFGRGETAKLERALLYRDQPAELFRILDKELAAREPDPDIAVAFRDYTTLATKGVGEAEVLDWIAAMRAAPTDAEYAAAPETAVETARGRWLAHGVERWRKSRDAAWLLAALSLANADDAVAGDLVRAAGAVKPADPAYVSAQYHLGRLTLATADAAGSRARLDELLRRDLSVSDRNIVTAQRAQVAADAADFVAFSLRNRICADGTAGGCSVEHWRRDSYQPGGVYDRAGSDGRTGFGEDARAVIDRLPLPARMALAKDARLPAPLRLDVTLTNYARALALGDETAALETARALETLLPPMAEDFRRIRTTPGGPQRRFAQLFILAKIPGVRLDLVDYTRPEGTVAQFQYYWTDWIFLPKGRPVAPRPPPLAAYQAAGRVDSDTGDAATDLSCLGECGRGAAPLRLPEFAAALSGQAAIERGYFHRWTGTVSGEPEPTPPGGVSAWNEMLEFARANQAHALVPEALYWLVRVGRWGGSHDRSGKRAFELLHARYPQSAWAKRSPYFYD
ncbi:MAG: hypothetical protein DI570_08460 [Phenylobacterium zucineum]|nr:MAG: hypothetical protein DI570_08460 [Phenylobacterium zucineum]